MALDEGWASALALICVVLVSHQVEWSMLIVETSQPNYSIYEHSPLDTATKLSKKIN